MAERARKSHITESNKEQMAREPSRQMDMKPIDKMSVPNGCTDGSGLGRLQRPMARGQKDKAAAAQSNNPS
jgi:hypothetical protein